MRGSAARLLLDTHIWYWYIVGSKSLPGSLRRAIDGALSSCWLSPITLWEIGMLAGKGRIRVRPDFPTWLARALDSLPVQEAALNFEVAKRVRDLDLGHGDPADHFLAATALVYDLTLVTVDRRFTAVTWLPTLTS